MKALEYLIVGDDPTMIGDHQPDVERQFLTRLLIGAGARFPEDDMVSDLDNYEMEIEDKGCGGLSSPEVRRSFPGRSTSWRNS